MRSAVVVFPGSNCDRDLVRAISAHTEHACTMIWHKDTSFPANIDILFIPGGFSFGDYLRCGAIAANSPIMASIINFAKKGGYILGICNGFQVLTEAGLLKGTLMRNAQLTFICKQQSLIINNSESIVTKGFSNFEKITLPIAHHDGNYYADDETINELEDNGQIVFRYNGNPNGSKNQIAGIMSFNQRIFGIMPHPERAVHESLGSTHGSTIFKSIIESF
jgi:phosphoribosylformylglycinamidine synthase I